MSNLLGYEGKKVVITGSAKGMGAAAAEMVCDLGAEVYALDIADVTAPVKEFIRTDMKDKASVDAAISVLPSEIDILFNCAGVPHPPFSATDTMMINFVGLRHLTDALLPRIKEGGAIASIASTAGMAWKTNLETVKSFLALETFEAMQAFLENDPKLNADPYGFSKQCIIVYTQMLAGELAKRSVRINCIAPSPTASNFMTDMAKGGIGEEVVQNFAPAHGRFADPIEMGRVMVLLGSDLAGFVSGVNLPVDYGYCAEIAMEQRDNLMNIS